MRNEQTRATVTARGAWCRHVPTCPIDQGTPRCRREVSGLIAGACMLLAVLLIVAGIAAGVVT